MVSDEPSVPHTARIWNYLLGGTVNFAVDRAVAEQVLVGQPALAENARLGRAYLTRVVRYLAGEAGIRQFLDIGAGLPTAENTHEVAQPVAVLFMGVLGHVEDDAAAQGMVRSAMDAVPSGSYLAVCDSTDDTPEVVEAARIWNESAALPYHLRSAARLARFFEGLELVGPGLVPVTRWRPETDLPEIDQYGAVGRKP